MTKSSGDQIGMVIQFLEGAQDAGERDDAARRSAGRVLHRAPRLVRCVWRFRRAAGRRVGFLVVARCALCVLLVGAHASTTRVAGPLRHGLTTLLWVASGTNLRDLSRRRRDRGSDRPLTGVCLSGIVRVPEDVQRYQRGQHGGGRGKGGKVPVLECHDANSPAEPMTRSGVSRMTTRRGFTRGCRYRCA